MDKRTRKQQIATLSIIAVAVITLSIGFAAFSSTLRISSQAQVNPNASAFSVIFSNDGSNTDTEQTVNPSSSTYGEAATITNSASPTISGLNAKFTSPGQSVSYSFYAKNTGSYLAYLNYITFNNVEGEDNNIVCTAQAETSQDLVDQACEGISISIKVGADEAVTTSQSGISNHTLAAGNSEPVIVTITYDQNAAVADGDFTVAFGDISLTYSTVSDYVIEGEETVEKVCTLADTDNDNVADVGEVVTCTLSESTDKFYVIEEANLETASTIQMLTEYNIHTTQYRQSTSAGTVAFSTTNYWVDENDNLLTKYGTTYPADVYEDNDVVKPIVDQYVSYLNEKLNNATGSLLTYSQATLLGCDSSKYTCGPDLGYGGASENPAPTWVYSSYYWLGSTGGANYEFEVYYIDYQALFGMSGSFGVGDAGVRPVITISVDNLIY